MYAQGTDVQKIHIIIIIIIIIKEKRKNVYPERILIVVHKKFNSKKNVYRPATDNMNITTNNI
jgi:hypothetical protein